MMVRAATPVEISAMPDLARLADEVARTGRSRLLKRGDEDVAILSPARPSRRARKPLTTKQREAILASVGGWEGLVDAEQLKRDLDAARGDNSPPIEP